MTNRIGWAETCTKCSVERSRSVYSHTPSTTCRPPVNRSAAMPAYLSRAHELLPCSADRRLSGRRSPSLGRSALGPIRLARYVLSVEHALRQG